MRCTGECSLASNGTAATLDVQVQTEEPLWARKDDNNALEHLARMLVSSLRKLLQVYHGLAMHSDLHAVVSLCVPKVLHVGAPNQ